MFDTERDLGRLEARVESLEEALAELRADVKSLLALANQGKGGLNAMFAAGSIIGALSALGGHWLLRGLIGRG